MIIGGLISAAVVAIANARKLNEATTQTDLMKHKYEEEKQKRRYSETKADNLKSEKSKLKKELTVKNNQKVRPPMQISKTISSKTVVIHRKPQTVIQKDTTIKVEESPIRCIRL